RSSRLAILFISTSMLVVSICWSMMMNSLAGAPFGLLRRSTTSAVMDNYFANMSPRHTMGATSTFSSTVNQHLNRIFFKMNTQPLTTERLARSVIAVPPLARDKNLTIDRAENKRLVEYLEQGGVTTLL